MLCSSLFTCYQNTWINELMPVFCSTLKPLFIPFDYKRNNSIQKDSINTWICKYHSTGCATVDFNFFGCFLVTLCHNDKRVSCAFASLFSSFPRIILLNNTLSHVHKYSCNNIKIGENRSSWTEGRRSGKAHESLAISYFGSSHESNWFIKSGKMNENSLEEKLSKSKTIQRKTMTMDVELRWDVKIIYRTKSSMLSLCMRASERKRERNTKNEMAQRTVSEFL